MAPIGLDCPGGVVQLKMTVRDPRPALSQAAIEGQGLLVVNDRLLQAVLQPQQVAQGQVRGRRGGTLLERLAQ